jgi:hypothetical protein
MIDADRLKLLAQSAIDSSNREIEKFKVSFAKHPLYALNWSEGTFSAAAELKVMSYVLQCLEPNGKATIESVEAYALDQVLRVAENPPRSTLATANLAEQATGEAWTKVYKWIQDRGL